MDDNFAVLDFALVALPPERVAEAAGGIAPVGDAEPEKRRLFGGLIGGGGKSAAAPAPYMIHERIPGGRGTLRREAPTSPLPDGAPLRLSGPFGPQELCLIELSEPVPLPADGQAPTIAALSAALGEEVELYYLRTSGARHPGLELRFHVYRNGQAIRRSATACAEIEAENPKWQAVDTGIPHPLEASDLPGPDTPPEENMTGERQAAILDALGVDPEMLFGAEADEPRFTIWLARLPGGRALGEAAALAQPAPAESRQEPQFTRPSPAGADPTSRERTLPPSQPPTPPQAEPDEGKAAAADPAEDEKWEADVTRLLIEAVEAALPEESQVAWLDGLTTQLVKGDVDGALDRAHGLIANGNRPEEARAAASARLAALFGRAAPDLPPQSSGT